MEYLLLYKKIHDLLNSEEKAVFDQWYEESPEHREYFRKAKKQFYSDSGLYANRKKGWNQLKHKLDFR